MNKEELEIKKLSLEIELLELQIKNYRKQMLLA